MGLFGGGSSSASSDPFAAFAAMQQAQAAQQQAALGSDWLGFAKQQYADSLPRQQALDELTGKVTQAQLAAQDQANQWAGEDRARYKSIFQPAQDAFLAKAQGWDSAANQDKVAAEAKAAVLSNAAEQKAAGERALAARGINPTSGAWTGIDRAAATQTALGAAGAQNTARSILRTQAIGLQGSSIDMGNGLPSQALDSSKLGVGAGTSAAGNQINAQQSWLANQGIMTSGFQGAGGLFKDAGNSWGDIYNSRTSLLSAQNEMAAAGPNAILGGLGSVAGMALGGASKPWILSDKDAKTNKRKARGILKAVKNMPVEKWRYKKGEGDEGEHVGPYAQDFKRETGLGDGKTISVIDAIGVTMGAVKELAEKVDRMSERKTAARPKSIFKKAA